MNLLIHGDPGARNGFIAALLTNKLTKVSFDSTVELFPKFTKIHFLEDANIIKIFDGVKIRIRPTLASIGLLSLLFLRKNIYIQMPNFTKNEYSLETFTKLTCFAKEIFEHDLALDYNLYDYVINFTDTFNVNILSRLYTNVTKETLAASTINIINQTNAANYITIDKNHACSIMKMVLTRELELGLKEENRHWSIVDVYHNTPIDQLYDTVYASIKPENYGA